MISNITNTVFYYVHVTLQHPILTTNQKVLDLIQNKPYSLLNHEPTLTSIDSARVRGTTLASGAKAMIACKEETNEFVMIVLSAARRVSLKKIKTFYKIKKLRLASPEEVYDITTCVIGAVPPFGSIFGIPTLVDESLQQQGEGINFNVGIREQSCSMAVKVYLEIEKPIKIGDFSESGLEN
jgi:Ala-tRNA(Pro) deacylase